MRLFVGLDFADRQKNNLEKTRLAFIPHLAGGRIIPTENMHCTLFFMGETDAARLEEICRALTDAARRHKKFMTGFWDTAHFRNGCAVVKLKTSKAFESLQKDVAAAMAPFAAKQDSGDKKYLPHVTLLRDAEFVMPFREVKKHVPVFNFPFEVTDFTLFESRRSESGMIYTPITFFNLAQ